MERPYPQCNLPVGYQGGGREHIAIELYLDGEFQHWFPTITAAAEFLGRKQNSVSQALKRGHLCNGYELRIGKSIEETINEIEHRTYQISRQ